MNLLFQKNSISELKQLANADRHSVLIEGSIGCGKSHLAKQYAKELNISDVIFVQPNVQDIREAMDRSIDFTNPILFCIENLDLGVLSASYTLLLFLEEPKTNVYIVVTCRNRYDIPDTIISRCTCVSIGQPVPSDINTYANSIDSSKYNALQGEPVWKGVNTLYDVDYVYKLNKAQIDYFKNLKSEFKLTDSVSNLLWKLGHYPDNSETDIRFVMNYLMNTMRNTRIRKYIIQCVSDLSSSRIAQHATLAKFLFNVKYGD